MLILLLSLSQPVERCYVVDSYEFTGDEYKPIETTEPFYTIGEAQQLQSLRIRDGEAEGKLIAAAVYGMGCERYQ